MKKICILIVYCFINLFANNIFFDEKIIIENGTKYIAKNIVENNRKKTVIEKIRQSQSFRIFEIKSKHILKIKSVLYGQDHLYLSFVDKKFCTLLSKISKDTIMNLKDSEDINLISTILKPPIKESSGAYGFNYEQHDDGIKINITGLVNDQKINIFNYVKFFYQNEEELWIPLNGENQKIYEDARSAIRGWVYDGKLKRWYPENNRGEIDKEIWFEQTPTTELRNYPQELWTKNYKGEKINFSEKFKEKIAEERERLNVEEEKRIAEEKQKLQQKIFIILGILFLVTFGGFLIKKLKKKKIIKYKNI